MRWPLRRQVLLPIIGILIVTVGAVSALNAWLATVRVRTQLETQLADITRTFSASNFPLESNVLRQTRGLTGADFVVLDRQRNSLAASEDALIQAVKDAPDSAAELDLSAAVTADGRRYIHVVTPLDRRPVGGDQYFLHVFYPEAAWRAARWQAIWIPLAIGLVAIAVVISAAPLLVARVTRPLENLRHQVRQIGTGRFAPLPLPARSDEIRDLAASLNQMARQLVRYEEETRKTERLKTLGMLGGGIAHQIRNAATGCRIALDLHQRDCPLAAANGHTTEPLGIAQQQLGQIESHLQRFLTLGRPTSVQRHATDLAEVAAQAMELVRPVATHVGVELSITPTSQPLVVLADQPALVQLVVNLLVNAVEATARTRLLASAKPSTDHTSSSVAIRIAKLPTALAEIAIGDPGPGPSAAIQPRLFEPFATDKPGGTGLGLAVARQIAEDHSGTIHWERQSHWTWFLVRLPLAASNAGSGTD